MLDTVQTIIRRPAVLLPRKHVFLLSHMRAYTSLFGHIMGSNPEICGYYEMHIGYHSWKSLVRQKLLYFEQEPAKPGHTCMFDKILHNDHDIAPAILDSSRVRVIFSLRPPQATIPSILSLYRSINQGHEFNSPQFSTRYYIERLAELERLAGTMRNDYFYFDAAALIDNTQSCLAALSDWLGLDTELSPEYEVQRKTSAERFGDSSERISSGRITARQPTENTPAIDGSLLSDASAAYQRARQCLLRGSARHILAAGT